MRIRPEDVRETAELARLALDEAELERVAAELDGILGYMDRLAAVDVSGIEPTTHAVPLDCPLRADEPGSQLSIEEALADAPRREGNLFEVPRIIESGT